MAAETAGDGDARRQRQAMMAMRVQAVGAASVPQYGHEMRVGRPADTPHPSDGHRGQAPEPGPQPAQASSGDVRPPDGGNGRVPSAEAAKSWPRRPQPAAAASPGTSGDGGRFLPVLVDPSKLRNSGPGQGDRSPTPPRPPRPPRDGAGDTGGEGGPLRPLRHADTDTVLGRVLGDTNGRTPRQVLDGHEPSPVNQAIVEGAAMVLASANDVRLLASRRGMSPTPPEVPGAGPVAAHLRVGPTAAGLINAAKVMDPTARSAPPHLPVIPGETENPQGLAEDMNALRRTADDVVRTAYGKGVTRTDANTAPLLLAEAVVVAATDLAGARDPDDVTLAQQRVVIGTLELLDESMIDAVKAHRVDQLGIPERVHHLVATYRHAVGQVRRAVDEGRYTDGMLANNLLDVAIQHAEAVNRGRDKVAADAAATRRLRDLQKEASVHRAEHEWEASRQYAVDLMHTPLTDLAAAAIGITRGLDPDAAVRGLVALYERCGNEPEAEDADRMFRAAWKTSAGQAALEHLHARRGEIALGVGVTPAAMAFVGYFGHQLNYFTNDSEARMMVRDLRAALSTAALAHFGMEARVVGTTHVVTDQRTELSLKAHLGPKVMEFVSAAYAYELRTQAIDPTTATPLARAIVGQIEARWIAAAETVTNPTAVATHSGTLATSHRRAKQRAKEIASQSRRTTVRNFVAGTLGVPGIVNMTDGQRDNNR